MISKNLIFILALLLPFCSFGQTSEKIENTEKKHAIGLSMGHTQVLKGFENGSKKWLSLPSWALDYSYRFSEKWGLKLQNEIIMSDFEVESSAEDNTITRSTPFSSLLAVSYYPVEFLSVYVASGGEFAKEENFALLRLGTEFAFEISESFEGMSALEYDYKIEGYDSFGITLGIGYKF